MENVTEEVVQEEPEPTNAFFIAIIAESCLSITFLLLLVLVFYRRKEHRTIMGKNMISLSCTLIVVYTYLASEVMRMLLGLTMSHWSCYILAVFAHFIYLAMIVWSNVISYDTMSVVISLRSNSSRSTSRFIKYSAYVWLTTFAIWSPSVVIDYFELLPEDYRPMFGNPGCYLNSHFGYIIFYMIPVLFIIAINIIFFALTIRAIRQVQNLCTQFEIKQHKKRICLYFKLILVMGLLRITMFLYILHPNIYVYYAVSCFNSLYGVYMFLLLACDCSTRNCLFTSFCVRKRESPVTSVTSHF